MNLINQIKNLEPHHQTALTWFANNHCAEDMPYTPKVDNVPIVSPAQGIFKPANSVYAFSVKETMKGIYPDQKPYVFPDGSSIYAYHQQGDDSENDRLSKSSNIAIDRNIQDQVPLGVFIQTQDKGRQGAKYSTYLALPLGWIDGFFILYIAPPSLILNDEIVNQSLVDLLGLIFEQHQVAANEEAEIFDPTNIADARKKMLRAISQRKGQPQFRRKLLQAYDGKCAISGCAVTEVLEAAHITPYNGELTNVTQNGLLLRSDLHLLWDKYLITIEADSNLIKVHPDLLDSQEYSQFHNQQLRLTNSKEDSPSQLSLLYHNKLCTFL